MITIKINDKEFKVKEDITILEAARDNKVHEKAIYNAANGETISSAGYYWCFEKDYSESLPGLRQ